MKHWPTSDADGHVEIEIHRLFEADDFGPALTPELRETEQTMRSQLGSKK